MKSLKFLALGLLCATQIATANINLELAVAKDEILLGANAGEMIMNQPAIVFENETMRIEAMLVSENLIKFAWFMKNEAGEFVLYATPELALVEKQTEAGVNLDGFDLAVRITQI